MLSSILMPGAQSELHDTAKEDLFPQSYNIKTTESSLPLSYLPWTNTLTSHNTCTGIYYRNK